MTVRTDAKFEEKLICSFKIDKSFVKFDKSTQKLSFMTLKGDAQFVEQMTCGLENDMRNVANFHQSTWKSQDWDFDKIP